jgi:hypothetical protein
MSLIECLELISPSDKDYLARFAEQSVVAIVVVSISRTLFSAIPRGVQRFITCSAATHALESVLQSALIVREK